MIRFLAAFFLVFTFAEAPSLATMVGQGGEAAGSFAPTLRFVLSPKPEPFGPDIELYRTVGDRVFFAERETHLTPEAKVTLDRLIVFLRDYPEVRVDLEGHAHDFDEEERDLQISKRRAEAAYDYLVAQGVAPERLKTSAYGYRRPAVPGDYAEARAQNRRVEFSVYDG